MGLFFGAGATASPATVFKVVAVLLVISFVAGLAVGYRFGQSSIVPSPPPKPSGTITKEQQQEIDKMLKDTFGDPEEFKREIERKNREEFDKASRSNNSNSETPQERIKRLKKELRELGEGTPSPSPTGKPPGQ